MTALLANAAEAKDPMTAVVLGLAAVMIFSLLGKELMLRLRQNAILGFLFSGIVLGNLKLAGIDALHFLLSDSFINTSAQLGVIILMFEAGLESSVHKMKNVGMTAILVASLGITTSILLGYLASRLLFSGAPVYLHWFVGVMIASTSVGVSAAVFKEMGKLSTKTANLILGAAVIDDVLGLISLAVVGSLIKSTENSGSISLFTVVIILVKALVFILGSILVGNWLSKHSFKLASKLQSKNVLLPVALAFCFLVCWVASLFGLAPMIGAFAAGLVLEDVHYEDIKSEEENLETLLKPFAIIFIPMFFVIVGTKVDLSVMTNLASWQIAVVLICAAVLGKAACAGGLIANKDRSISKLAVIGGMMARGEVVIVIAEQGRTSLQLAGKPLVSPELFAAVIIMVVFSIVITPPILNKSMKNSL